MKNKKGFSLIELLAIIIIIGLILIVALPAVSKLLKTNNTKMYDKYYDVVKAGALRYSEELKDDLGGYNDIGCTEVSLDDLIKKNIIKKYNEKNITCEGNAILRNNKGNVSATVNFTCKNKRGVITYEIGQLGANCDSILLEPDQEPEEDEGTDSGDLTISITNKKGVFNTNDWAKEDFEVSIVGKGSSYKWCSSTDGECIPDTIVNNSSGSLEIKSEGTNTVCAMAINDASQSEVKCNSFKLDKTKPVITNATISKNSSKFTVVANLDDNLSSSLTTNLVSKTTYSQTVNELPHSYSGTVETLTDNTLTLTVTDEAGNTTIAKGYLVESYTEVSSYEVKNESECSGYVYDSTFRTSLKYLCSEGYYVVFKDTNQGIGVGEQDYCCSKIVENNGQCDAEVIRSYCPEGYIRSGNVCSREGLSCKVCSSGSYDSSLGKCVIFSYQLQIVE